MGSDIDVRSEPGEGSTFVLRLPLVQQRDMATADASSQRGREATG